MMRRLTLSTRFFMGKHKEFNPNLGLLGQPPDLKGRALDKYKRVLHKVHLLDANEAMPDFEKQRHDLAPVQRSQVQTRILRLIRDLEFLDVRKVRWDADLRRDLKVDSLNMVALLTSIEHEFTTVFEDNVFEGIKTLQEVVTILMRDPKII